MISQEEGDLQATYFGVMLYRRILITVSSIALLINIIVIIKQKQYVYNTIKLLMLVEIFYFISLISVLPHHASMNLSQSSSGMNPWIQNTTLIGETVNNMINEGDTYGHIGWCATQGLVNLSAYNISYFFAIMIAVYVNRVLSNTHKNFMRKFCKLYFIAGIGIVGVYLVPFVFSFILDFLYSFGPTGFFSSNGGWIGSDNNGDQYYFFYCGLVNRRTNDDVLAVILQVANMALIPVFLFIIHSVYIYKNYIGKKGFAGQEELNPRQMFIIQSRKISNIIFGIQTVNVLKLGLALSSNNIALDISWVLNMLFDFCPLGIVFYYFSKYYRRGIKIGMQGSLIRDTDSLISNDFAI